MLKIILSQIFNMISRCTLHRNNIRPALTRLIYLKVKPFRFPIHVPDFHNLNKVKRGTLKLKSFSFSSHKKWILHSIVFYSNLESTTPDCYTTAKDEIDCDLLCSGSVWLNTRHIWL